MNRTPTATRAKTRIIVACLIGIASASTLAAVTPLSDSQARKFFNDKGCNACHSVDETRLAPTFRQIAARYASAPHEDTAQLLAQKIIHGGAGNWGVVPMISNPRLSTDEAESITAWILSLSPPANRKTLP